MTSPALALTWWWAGTRKYPWLWGWGLPIMGTGFAVLGVLDVDRPIGRKENKRNKKSLTLSSAPSFAIQTHKCYRLGWHGSNAVTIRKFRNRRPSIVACRAQGAGMAWDINSYTQVRRCRMAQDIHMHGCNEPGQQTPKLI